MSWETAIYATAGTLAAGCIGFMTGILLRAAGVPDPKPKDEAADEDVPELYACPICNAKQAELSFSSIDCGSDEDAHCRKCGWLGNSAEALNPAWRKLYDRAGYAAAGIVPPGVRR